MGSVLVDGKVIGNISVERLTLRGEAVVHGNITCKSLTVDPTVIIVGSANVHPQAPRCIDTEGRLLPEPEDTTPPPKKLSALGQSKSMSKITKTDALAPAVSKEDLLRHTTDEKIPLPNEAKSEVSEPAPASKKPQQPKTKPHDMSPERSNLHGEKSAKSVVDTEKKQPKKDEAAAKAPEPEVHPAGEEEGEEETQEEEGEEQEGAEENGDA